MGDEAPPPAEGEAPEDGEPEPEPEPPFTLTLSVKVRGDDRPTTRRLRANRRIFPFTHKADSLFGTYRVVTRERPLGRARRAPRDVFWHEPRAC
jgi:hypothetical protein